MKWEELPLADRAKLMAAAVRNGYTDIRSIKEAYANYQNQKLSAGNRYAEGGDMDEDSYHSSYNEWKKAIAKHHHLDIDNDNTYDYMGFYYSDPARAWAMLDEDSDSHFTDEFKTAAHPTFSNLSTYSGKYDPVNNPLVATGGTWTENPNTFTLPKDWYKGPSIPERINYLERAEDNGVTMFMPDGSLPVLYNNEPWGGVLPAIEVTNQNAYGGNLFQTGGNKKSKKKSLLLKLQERRDYYRQLLIIRGLRGAQLEAVLANMEVESGFNPDNVNPYSGAKGLMQWLGSRKPKSWSEKDQLDYIAATYNKFGGNEWLDKAAWKRFNETTDPAEAARLFRRYWERPERSSWNATDALFKNSKGSYLPKEVNDLVAQVSNLQYDEPKAPIFTEEDQRLLDTPALAFYNPEYEDTQAPDHKPSALQKSIKLDESLWRDPANNWALYNQFANMQQGSSLDDPLGLMIMMASLSPKTTPEQKEAASTIYQLFAPQDGDYMYHGLNFAAYGGKINKFDDGGFFDLPEQRAYRRAINLKSPYTNYEDAIDMDDSIMLRLKKFFDKGVSNCTLTASQFFNPARPIGRARTIVQDSIPNGFYEVDENHVVPGTMVIASYPNISDYNPDQKYHTMVVTGFAPEDYEYTFRDGTKYQIKKGEPLVSYSRGKASPDNYITGIPLSVYNDKGEGKTYNRYYRPIDEEYPEYMLPNLIITNQKANGGHLFAEGGNLFYKGGLEDQFANTYLGIGQFPDYDSDFIATNNLQYLPYSQLNMMGHDPENIRIGNQGNQTMYAYDDKDATYLADANGNLVTSPLLHLMTLDYVKEHYGPMLLKAFLSNPDKYWDEYNRYRTNSITFDENGNPVSSGQPPVEKPIEPVAPEFWLLSAGASKAPSTLNSVISPLFNMVAVDNVIDDVTPYTSFGNLMSENVGGPEWAWNLIHPAIAKDLWNLSKTAGKYIYNKVTKPNLTLTSDGSNVTYEMGANIDSPYRLESDHAVTDLYKKMLQKEYYDFLRTGKMPETEYTLIDKDIVNSGYEETGLGEDVVNKLIHDTLGRRKIAHQSLSDSDRAYYKMNELDHDMQNIENAAERLKNIRVGTYDADVFNHAGIDENIQGMHFSEFGEDPSSIIIKLGEKDIPAIKRHEGEHEIDEFIELTPEQKKKLKNAYDQDFVGLPDRVPEDDALFGYENMEAERTTTNGDARDIVLKHHAGTTDIYLQNKIIDKTSDEKIFEAVEKANGYGRRYITWLREHNKLTPKKALEFREAMKIAGITGIVAGTIYPTSL